MKTAGIFEITPSELETFLKLLLSDGIVSSILAPEAKKERTRVTPTFISDAKQIENLPISDLMVYHYNLINSAATTMFQSKRSINEKVAVIARSCEIRAFIEQHKLRQTNFDNLFIIAIDEIGYVDPRQASKLYKDKKIPEDKVVYEKLTKDKLIMHVEGGKSHIFDVPKDVQIVDNCLRCAKKTTKFADVTISTLGTNDMDKTFVFTAYSERAMALVKKLNWESKKASEELQNKKQKLLEDSIQEAEKRLKKDLDEFNKRTDKLDSYNKCTVCGMCVRACPVCICPVCALTELKKEEKIDPITFLMTRVAHVGDICINCGKCDLMCPMKIPLSLMFNNLAENLKNEFGYSAGKDKDDTTFHLRAKDVKKEATF